MVKYEMQNPNRLIDRTHLSLDLAEERILVHRDYLAHCHRWSHVARFLNREHAYKDAVILDVGCGKEFPLAKLLYVNKMSPVYYVGVDANKLTIPEMLQDKKIPIKAWAETDFCDLTPQDVGLSGQRDGTPCWYYPNTVVCFEVLEHVTPGHARRMLQHMLKLSTEDAHYFISTPCYNGSAAGNHINEMAFGALGSMIEDLDLNIDGVWGTFASIRDYKDQLPNWTHYYEGGEANPATTNLLPLFEVLAGYYDTNVLATIFAPLFPASARNCLWHLTRHNRLRRFSKLVDAPTPWSQHPDWRDLAGGELPAGEQAKEAEQVAQGQ